MVIILLAVSDGITVGATEANAFEVLGFATSPLVGGVLVTDLGSSSLGAAGGMFGDRYAESVARNA